MTLPNAAARSVARHRLEASPAFQIELGILQMLDVVTHQVLEDDLRTHGSPWVHLSATDDIAERLPDEPGLYMFVWSPAIQVTMADGTMRGFQQVLYVGQAGGADQSTNTLKARFKNYRKHMRGDPESLWAEQRPTHRAGQLNHYLALRPLEYWYTTVADRNQIESLERRMINLYNPPANTQNRPKLRARFQGTPQPAFGN